VKTRKHSHIVTGKRRSRAGKAALPALVAAGGGLAVGSAAALELGELQVQSTLGQPLRASIAYALSANEIIDDHCVAIRSGSRDLPGLHNADVRVSKGVISISGRAPVTEPMLSANLVVDCPYSAHVSRNYLMFLNPQDRPVTIARQSTPATPVATVPASRRSAAAQQAVAASPIAPDSRYLVQRGDSLSGIVRRIENRNVTAALAMAAIVDANPDAFIGGSPDKLKAGSWLDIPSFAGGVVSATAVAAPATAGVPVKSQHDATAVSQASAGASLYQGAETLEQDASKQIPATEFLPDLPEPAVDETVAALPETSEGVADEPAAESDYSAAYADLVAGDVIVEETAAADPAPPVEAAAPARVIKPGAGTRIVGSPQPAGSSWNWLIWAAAGLITAFGSYLMFWPRLRERFASKPVGADEQVPPRSEHVPPISVPESEMTVQEIKPTYDNVDFDLSDDSPTEENLALDADLIDGTGFDDSDDVDVNRDFGFAATMDLDLELPEKAAAEDSSPETDIIPPPERPEEDLIVDSEVLPDDDDDEYDISMVVDATKMPDPAEVTERDLKAVPLDDTGQTQIHDDFTIVDDIGGNILVQDYEYELSATQLLHAEIEKAASELADTLGEEDRAGGAAASGEDDGGRMVGSEDDTSIEMQLTNLSELDLTATLEAQNDDVSEDLDVTANIEADDKTVEMPRDKDGARAR
jgi:hypothetical protein